MVRQGIYVVNTEGCRHLRRGAGITIAWTPADTTSGDSMPQDGTIRRLRPAAPEQVPARTEPEQVPHPAPSTKREVRARSRSVVLLDRSHLSAGSRFALARNPSHQSRPNGPGEPSPGLRPQADALGNETIKPCGLKGREKPGLSRELRRLRQQLSRPVRPRWFDRFDPRGIGPAVGLTSSTRGV